MPSPLASLPKWFSMNVLMEFIFSNIVWLVAAGVIGYIILTYLRVGTRTKIKPINRAEIERIKFIERMKHNKSKAFNWLRHGNRLIGRIDALDVVSLPIKGNPAPEKKVIRLLIKPTLTSKLPIVNPLAKTQAFQLGLDNIDTDIGGKNIIVPKWLTFDYYFGIYYDMGSEESHIKLIKEDNLFRSDLNQLASIYYAKSQEQSTFDPEKAHQLAMKEKELQIEMAKKHGKITSI